ncbi:MAG: hypothetical protein ISS47_01790 [Candidatus Omnitrophica bacterium]|nr:hypothetical protein [Candidatus Omnitrophota bacterium]
MKNKTKVFKIVLICCLIILAVEWLLRIFFNELECKTFNPVVKVYGEYLKMDSDKERLWKLRGFGITDDFFQADIRIVVLSDSVTVMYEGKGYPEILEVVLSKKMCRDIKVLNAGVPCYTSYQGLVYFREELVHTKPHLVIVNFGWNDHWCSINRKEDKNQKISKVYFIGYSICKLSKIFSWVENLLYNSIIRPYLQKKLAGLDVCSCTKRVSLEDYEANLEEIVKLCKKNNIEVILMTSVYLRNNTDWLPLHIKYNELVEKVGKAYGVPVLDLVNEFKYRKDFFLQPAEDYCHINWLGSKVVAQELTELILQN